MRTEYDEGMNSYNRPLRIDSSSLRHNNDYRRTAPVLLFNIGQLHVLGGDDATAANYFMYNQHNASLSTSESTCQAEEGRRRYAYGRHPHPAQPGTHLLPCPEISWQ